MGLEVDVAASARRTAAGQLDLKFEVVAEIARRDLRRRLLEAREMISPPLELELPADSRVGGEAQIEREPTGQRPLTGGDIDQSSQQAIEDDMPAKAVQARFVTGGAILQALLEALPERGGVLKFHAHPFLA